MNWIDLNNIQQLDELKLKSKETPVLIFKHSRSCSISKTALDRLERSWNGENITIPTYFLDLLSHRNISNEIASQFEVPHQSPQAIVIKGGASISDWSHFDISYQQIKGKLS